LAEWNQSGDKAYIRNQMIQKRNSISALQREQWSMAACMNAQALLESRSKAAFMVYVPFRSELDLTKLIEWGWQSGREVIVPRCIAADRSMTLHYLRSWDQLASGAYGIMEPNPLVTPAIEKGFVPDIVFVPGLAFDRKGGRLGYGGGYYDRFAASQLELAGEAARTLWIGTAFEAQLVDEVPLEEHDLPMHGIITELDVYLF